MSTAPEDAPLPPGPPTEEEVLADARLRERLAAYNPLHHELFLKSYARLLDDLHLNGTIYEENLEFLLHQHDKPAAKALWLIQRQKLFDLECEWRAGRVAVPEARICADFADWQEYIEECTVIPPISPDEVALLADFMTLATDSHELTDGNFCNLFWMYRDHRDPDDPDPDDEEEDEERLTPFTHFWDERRGTGYLRQLPNLRGEQERRYRKVAHDQPAADAPPPAAPKPADPRPHVPTYGPKYDDLLREYLRRFEPATKLRQFEIKQQLEGYDASEDRLDLPLALERLQNAGTVAIPIAAHSDWRQAVIAAGHRYYLDQVRDALPAVYEDYYQRHSLGISHVPPEKHRYRERGGHFAHAEAYIREGRRLLGEPDDLNF